MGCDVWVRSGVSRLSTVGHLLGPDLPARMARISSQGRAAVVYCRQSTLIQVERNRESTLRQYDLAGRAAEPGWPRLAIRVIDADLGISGPG